MSERNSGNFGNVDAVPTDLDNASVASSELIDDVLSMEGFGELRAEAHERVPQLSLNEMNRVLQQLQRQLVLTQTELGDARQEARDSKKILEEYRQRCGGLGESPGVSDIKPIRTYASVPMYAAASRTKYEQAPKEHTIIGMDEELKRPWSTKENTVPQKMPTVSATPPNPVGYHYPWMGSAHLPNRGRSTPLNRPPILRPPILRQPEQSSEERFNSVEAQLSVMSNAVSLMAQVLHRMHRPRGVPPAKFNPAEDQDLTMFFVEFEKYSNAAYPEQKDEWVILLGNYLEGSYVKLYHQIRKSHKGYDAVKRAFLKWWEVEQKRKRAQATQDFMLARMEQGEELKMFALRLEELATRAFPGVPMRYHDSLRETFMRCMPQDVECRMRDYIANVEGTTESTFDFDQIVRLADQHYHRLGIERIGVMDREPEVIDISQVTSVETSGTRSGAWADVVKRVSQRPALPSAKVAGVESHGKPRGSPSRKKQLAGKASQTGPSGNFADTDMLCDYCGKTNHELANCFVYHGICSYCKQQGHDRTTCEKILRRQVASSRAPRCPNCSGDHFGKDCPKGDHTRVLDRESPLPQRPSRVYENRSGARTKTCVVCGQMHEAGACGSVNPLN